MPTTRRRHMITESDQLSVMLDAAARHWPEDADSRAQLMLRLVVEGYQVIQDAEAVRRADWVNRVNATAGVLSGTFEPGYLEREREDWPA